MAKPVYQIDRYFNFMASIVIMFGIIFEMPLVITALGYFKIVDYQLISKFKKYALVIIFILAAVLSPPDIISQFLMALPMVVLFEISHWVLKIMEKGRFNE